MNKHGWWVGLGVVLVGVASGCSSTKGANEAESTTGAPGDATAAPTSQAAAPKKKFKVAKLEIDDVDGGESDNDAVAEIGPLPTAASATPRGPMTEHPAPPPHTKSAGDSGGTTKNEPHKVGAAQSTSAAGQMSRENIESTLDKSEDTFGQCAETSSTFSARVIVAPNGSVSEARVTQSVPDDPHLRDCLTEALRRLAFPPTNAPVPLSFSLAIEPV